MGKKEQTHLALFMHNEKDSPLIQSRQFSGVEAIILITCLIELTRPNGSNKLKNRLFYLVYKVVLCLKCKENEDQDRHPTTWNLNSFFLNGKQDLLLTVYYLYNLAKKEKSWIS